MDIHSDFYFKIPNLDSMNIKELHKYLEPSLYRILCLDSDASLEMIRNNYKELCKIEHPDISKEPEQVAHDKFLAIKFAYDVLSKIDLKAKYDLLLNAHLKEKENRVKAADQSKKVVSKNIEPDENELFGDKEMLHVWKDILESVRDAKEELRKMGKDM